MMDWMDLFAVFYVIILEFLQMVVFLVFGLVSCFVWVFASLRSQGEGTGGGLDILKIGYDMAGQDWIVNEFYTCIALCCGYDSSSITTMNEL